MNLDQFTGQPEENREIERLIARVEKLEKFVKSIAAFDPLVMTYGVAIQMNEEAKKILKE